MFDRLKLPVVSALLCLTFTHPPAAAAPTLLFDASSGRVLYAEDVDDLWHPASLTKMMTAYVTFQALKSGKITLESPITYSENAFNQPPSKIGLPVGSTISVDLALQALVVKSANDIAVALAETLGGSQDQFVAEMNATAGRLGMARTTFRNPHGLPASDQVTTARDLAKLAAALIRDFPDRAHYWALTQMEIGKIKIASHNGLFKTFEGADGMKTGFICDSGYNIVASATRDGVKLMAVVLGQATIGDRNSRAHELLDHGYTTLGWKTLLGGKDTLTTMPVSPDAKDATSIRDSVVSFECHTRRVARAAATARKRTNARRVAEGSAKKSPAGPAATTVQTAGQPAATQPAKPKAHPAVPASSIPAPSIPAKAAPAAPKPQQTAG